MTPEPKTLTAGRQKLTDMERRICVGSWKFIPPLKKYWQTYATEVPEDAVPTVTQTVAWDMNDLRRMSKRELELLILDVAKEHKIFAAMSDPDLSEEGFYIDRWLGWTKWHMRDDHEFLVHKLYSMFVFIVFPKIFFRLRS